MFGYLWPARDWESRDNWQTAKTHHNQPGFEMTIKTVLVCLCIGSGGTKVTVTGNNLDSVAEPRINLTVYICPCGIGATINQTRTSNVEVMLLENVISNRTFIVTYSSIQCNTDFRPWVRLRGKSTNSVFCPSVFTVQGIQFVVNDSGSRHFVFFQQSLITHPYIKIQLSNFKEIFPSTCQREPNDEDGHRK